MTGGTPDRLAPLMALEPSPEAPVPFGKYQLIRRIGAGGMGEVFLAREGGPAPRAVVVKKVLPNLVENRAFVGRFLDEAKVVVRLKHPNIARVFAMGDVNGEYFLTMEYVQGKTVSRFTKRLREKRVELPLGIALLLAERICHGLDYAHQVTDDAGAPLALVHRDLSPANVCISYKGEVKIIDFGAASSTLKEEQTAPRVVIGNLTYMAPEQAKKQIVDGRADLYSLGVVLWELLAWHALPQKGDPIERWRKAANPVWNAPSFMRPSVPFDVDEVVLRALKRDPKERYASAAQMGEALKKVRARHAPEVTEKDLGELLARVFAEEKEGEDAVLYEVIHGRTNSEVKSTRVMVPPTALAFEHTVAEAPSEPDRLDLTEPGRARGPVPPPAGETPRDRRPTVSLRPPPARRTETVVARASRRSFGVSFEGEAEPRIEKSIIEEIEGDEVDTADQPVGPPLGRVALLAAVFVGATSLGFLAVWLAFNR